MIFRKATFNDISELSQMRWDFQTESEEHITTSSEEQFLASCEVFYRDVLESSGWLFWLAEAHGQIIAHVAIHIINNLPTPDRLNNKWGHLTNTYTKKAYRNQGVGAHLVELAVNEGRSLGLETLIVWPSEDSIPLYRRAGFSVHNSILELPFRE